MTKWIVDHTKDNKRFGIHIEGINSKDVLLKAKLMGLRNIEVIGKLLMIIPIKNGKLDRNNKIDYDIIQFN